MLFEGHSASFDNFSILLKEANGFKLYLKDYLPISHDKPISYRSIFLFHLHYW